MKKYFFKCSKSYLIKAIIAFIICINLISILFAQDTQNDFRETESVSESRVYANPAINHFFVDVPNINELSLIRLLTLEGGLIKEVSSTSSTIRMDIAEVPTGMYLVTISQGNSVVRKKLQIIK